MARPKLTGSDGCAPAVPPPDIHAPLDRCAPAVVVLVDAAADGRAAFLTLVR